MARRDSSIETRPTTARRRRRGALAALFAPLLSSCVMVEPSDIPRDEPWVVVVRSRLVGRTWFGWAHHSWIDVKEGGESRWKRYEVFRSGVAVHRIDGDEAREADRFPFFYPDTSVKSIATGETARRAAEILAREAELYACPENRYRLWPGPNSNAFVARMVRELPGLRAELDHNAVGKDHAGIVRAGWTTTGTGVALDTPVLGAQAGLVEGVELHFLQLTFGVSIFPPAIKLPALPRIGFPAHVPRGARSEPAPAAAGETPSAMPAPAVSWASWFGQRRKILRWDRDSGEG